MSEDLKSQEEREDIRHDVIQENMKSPEGRIALWRELVSVYVAPVEKQGLEMGHASFKEYASHDRLVAKLRKKSNKLGEILQSVPDSVTVPTASIMEVIALFAKIDTLQEVILQEDKEEQESDVPSSAADSDFVTQTLSESIDSEPHDLEQIKQYKRQSLAVEAGEAMQITAADHAEIDDEAAEQGFVKTQRVGTTKKENHFMKMAGQTFNHK